MIPCHLLPYKSPTIPSPFPLQNPHQRAPRLPGIPRRSPPLPPPSLVFSSRLRHPQLLPFLPLSSPRAGAAPNIFLLNFTSSRSTRASSPWNTSAEPCSGEQLWLLCDDYGDRDPAILSASSTRTRMYSSRRLLFSLGQFRQERGRASAIVRRTSSVPVLFMFASNRYQSLTPKLPSG